MFFSVIVFCLLVSLTVLRFFTAQVWMIRELFKKYVQYIFTPQKHGVGRGGALQGGAGKGARGAMRPRGGARVSLSTLGPFRSAVTAQLAWRN